MVSGALFAAVLLWLTPAAAIQAPAEADPLLRKGLESVQAERFEQALEAFQEFKLKAPDDPRGYRLSGLTLARAGRTREAVPELRRALDLAPDHLPTRLALAHVLKELRQLDDALQVLLPAQQEGEPETLWALAQVLFEQESFSRVKQVLQRYGAKQPDDLRTTLLLGQIAIIEGDFEAAEQDFRTAIQRDDSLAPAFHGLGLALWRRAKLEEARTALGEAVEQEPNNAVFRLDLGRLLLESGDAQEARKHLESALAAPAPPAAVHFELGRAYRRLGLEEQAAEQTAIFQKLDEAAKREESRRSEVLSLLNQAKRDLEAGRIEEAHDGFLAVLRLDPDQAQAHSFLAKIYISSNLPREAQTHLNRYLEIEPTSAEAYYLQANLDYRTRRYPAALKAGERARELRPDYAELRNLLGNIHWELGQVQEAIAEYEAAVRLAPERQDFKLNLETARRKR